MKQGYKLTITITLLFSCLSVTAADKPISFGFFPYVSPAKLIKHQKGLIDHFTQGISQPISISTASNFREYIDNVKAGKYDIIYSAPHLARLAEIKYGYQRISMTTHKIRAFLLVPKQSDHKNITDLKHKTIAIGPPLAIVHQIAVQTLHDQGMQQGKDYTLNVTKTHDNAIFSLINGDSDAAITGIKIWKTLRPHYKNKLRVLSSSIKSPGFMILGNSKIPKTTIEKLKSLSASFNKTPAGQKYLFNSLKPIDNNSMKEMDNYITVLK